MGPYGTVPGASILHTPMEDFFLGVFLKMNKIITSAAGTGFAIIHGGTGTGTHVVVNRLPCRYGCTSDRKTSFQAQRENCHFEEGLKV